MEILFSVKIIGVKFYLIFYVLGSPESKKVVLGNWSVLMYVYVGGVFSTLYLRKKWLLIQNVSKNFKTKYLNFFLDAFSKALVNSWMSQFGSPVFELGNACIGKSALAFFFKRHT